MTEQELIEVYEQALKDWSIFLEEYSCLFIKPKSFDDVIEHYADRGYYNGLCLYIKRGLIEVCIVKWEGFKGLEETGLKITIEIEIEYNDKHRVITIDQIMNRLKQLKGKSWI